MRGATLERFGAVLIGQFEMREPTAAEVKHAVDAPVGARAARLGLQTQVPSASRKVRPGQRSSAPGIFAASSRSTRTARNSVAWSSRYLTPGLLSSAIPCMEAQAAVWRNESPPGPRASAIRNKAAPSTTSRRRWIALASSAKISRSRPAGSRSSTSENRSVRTDAASCICLQNQAAPSRVKHYFSAYGDIPALCGVPSSLACHVPPSITPARSHWRTSRRTRGSATR